MYISMHPVGITAAQSFFSFLRFWIVFVSFPISYNGIWWLSFSCYSMTKTHFIGLVNCVLNKDVMTDLNLATHTNLICIQMGWTWNEWCLNWPFIEFIRLGKIQNNNHSTGIRSNYGLFFFFYFSRRCQTNWFHRFFFVFLPDSYLLLRRAHCSTPSHHLIW